MTAPSALRAGAGGGVFLLPPDELIRLAQAQVTRGLTDEECRAAGLVTCSDPRESVASGLVIAGGDEAYAGGRSARPLVGASVELVTPLIGLQRTVMQANFEAFTEQTGIEVVVRSQRADQETFLLNLDEADILNIPQPGAIPTIAPGKAMDLTLYLDRDELEVTQSPYLTSLLSRGDDGSWPVDVRPRLRGVGQTRCEVADLVQRRGLRRVGPGSARDLGRAGADQRSDRRKRRHPVVHLNRVRARQRLAGHRHHRVHPAPIRGARFLRQVVLPRDRFRPPGGRRLGAPRRRARVHTRVPRSQPGCSCPDCLARGTSHVGAGTAWLHVRAVRVVRSRDQPESSGRVIDAFDFPTIDPQYSDTMVGAGTYVVAVTDRPEVREVIKFIASSDYGRASIEAGVGHIPANTRFDLDLIPNATERRIAELTHGALACDEFRFDASDLMPVEVGVGTFWAGMVDWFVDGPEALDGIMAGIEAGWPEDEPAG